MLEADLGVRAALSTPPFVAFCELKNVEPPRRGCLEALCGGSDVSQRPAPPSFEQHYRSRRQQMPTTVEAYGRSAAGVVVEPSHLRTPAALEKSMHFLVHHYLRDPHTPAVFLAPFDVWRYLWDRMRQARTNWVPQLPPVGTESLSSHDYADGILPRSVMESKRRLKWLEFTVAALAVGGANLCRTVQGCRQYMAEKQNFLESIAQCFSDLVLSYRAEQRLHNSEMFSAVLLFYGLSQLAKVENRAGFCRVIDVQVKDVSAPTHVFELPASSVDFGSVYRELAYLPHMARTRHVRIVLKLIHSWCQREWFRFFYLCRTEPLTVLQRAMVFHSFSYARFRAVVDLVTANEVVYSKARLRGEMPIAELAELLLMEEAHCVELLETMGLAAQLSEDRTNLRVAQSNSLPYTTQEFIYRHLDETGGKPRLCLPTMPSFFGFSVWHRAFELFPDAFGENPLATHGDLRVMTCPVNLMRLLEPYCPPYNDDVAALELTDVGNEWFADIQEEREKMLIWIALNNNRFFYVDDMVNVNNGKNYNEGDDKNFDGDVYSESEELTHEERLAIVEAMDKESQSTHSSIFDDNDGVDGDCSDGYYTFGGGKSGEQNDENIETEGVLQTKRNNSVKKYEDEGDDEEEIVRTAKALLASLQNDAVYTKMHKELNKTVAVETTFADAQNSATTSPKSVYNSSDNNGNNNNNNDFSGDNLHNDDDGDGSDSGSSSSNNNNSKRYSDKTFVKVEQHEVCVSQWLNAPPPPPPPVAAAPSVAVTQLPDDHPCEMSPSLRAVVETPQSVATDSRPSSPFAEKEKKYMRSVNLGKKDAQVMAEGKMTTAFSSFPPLPPIPSYSLPSNLSDGVFLPLNVESDTDDRRKTKRKREEFLPNDTDSSKVTTDLPFLRAKINKQEKGEREEKQIHTFKLQEQQLYTPVGEGTSCPVFCNPTTILPCEKEARRQQDADKNITLIDPPFRQQEEPQANNINHHQQQPKVEGESTHNSHSTRKVTFVTTPPVIMEQSAPVPTKMTLCQQFPQSYLETMRRCLRNKRESCGNNLVGRTLRVISENNNHKNKQQQLEQQLHFFCSLSAANATNDADMPFWIHAFTRYLLGFFVSSCDSNLVRRFLYDVICCTSDAQARNVAGWLCRGFMPTIISRTAKYEVNCLGGNEMPTLRFSSTIVVFGNGIRKEERDNTTIFLPRCSTLYGISSNEIKNATLSCKLGRCIASLLLPENEGVFFLANNASFGLSEEETDREFCGLNCDDLIGFWEQIHTVHIKGFSSLMPAAEWSQDDFLFSAAHIKRARKHTTALQTQVTLHAVDHRDVNYLRWAKTTVMNGASALQSVEHINAIVTIDATLPDDYEDGINTLRFLVQQAARYRSVSLAGVIIVLYSKNSEEDVLLQKEMESLFWAMWQECVRAKITAESSSLNEEEELLAGRRAYQQSVRQALKNRREKEVHRREISTHMSNIKLQPNGYNKISNKSLNAICSFFCHSCNKDEASCSLVGDMSFVSADNISLPNLPSPVFYVLPIRSVIKDTLMMSVDNSKISGSEFVINNTKEIRSALLKALTLLLCEYETRCKEFLREKTTLDTKNKIVNFT